ncbi:hypothetical protein HJC23_007075 [Cyclotella cryptica]|uniref:Uncharacterized protein n=1 Tax=Cyclotella cryptica TaxID=29204 RepID=A0ABD3PA76_9STRA|eukprot:CCRYP_016456-RA/>CCRYP_016456-RA protein AED:0.32 eAED:0.32 QI:0/-1/0/1/-1/1/1/0/281
MKSILSLGIAAITVAAVSAETTIAVLEFGKGGSVRRTSANDESTPAGVASFFNAMHRPSKSHQQHAGMSLVPDIFNRADAGIVVGFSGVGVESMSTAMKLIGEGAADVVGHLSITGSGTDVIKRASKDVEAVAEKDEIGRRLHATAEKALEGGMHVVSITVTDESAAAEADEQLERMLRTLKAKAAQNDMTFIVHLVVDTPSYRRRLEDVNNNQQDDAVNQAASSSYYGQKTMVEIQNFNVIAWTAVGLVVLVFFVMSNFIAMPLMPDTLLHGEAAKIGTD